MVRHAAGVGEGVCDLLQTKILRDAARHSGEFFLYLLACAAGLSFASFASAFVTLVVVTVASRPLPADTSCCNALRSSGRGWN